MIELNEAHEYTKNKVRKPGVNEILNLYFPPNSFYTEMGKEIGKVRHQWYSFLSEGKEPNVEPDPRIAGEVQAFRKWLADVKPVRKGGETPIYDRDLHVCGTPDWYGEINGRMAVVDFKPQNKAKRTIIQTVAYKLNLISNGIIILDRYELRLSDGDYRFEQHTNPMDANNWRAMVYAFFASSFYR